MTDSSWSLHNKKHEQFCNFIADGLDQQEAYCRVMNADPSPSARVGGSRWAAKFADRIAYLRQERADARNVVDLDPSPRKIRQLMDQITEALMRASSVAQAHGYPRIANTLRQSLTRHVGRAGRIAGRNGGNITNDPDAEKAQEMARRYLEIP